MSSLGLSDGPAPVALPTSLAALSRLLAYTQSLGLERHLHRPRRGIATLVLALTWLLLAWRGTGHAPTTSPASTRRC